MHPDKQKRQPLNAPTYDGVNERKAQALAYEWWANKDHVPSQLSTERKIKALGYDITYSPSLHKVTVTRIKNGAGR